MFSGLITLKWSSERYAIMCLALVILLYTVKVIWSVSVIVGVTFLVVALRPFNEDRENGFGILYLSL